MPAAKGHISAEPLHIVLCGGLFFLLPEYGLLLHRSGCLLQNGASIGKYNNNAAKCLAESPIVFTGGGVCNNKYV